MHVLLRIALAGLALGLCVVPPLHPAAADCPQDLRDLDATVEGLRQRSTGALAEQLRSLRDAARRLQESGDTEGCTRVAQQGLALWNRMGAIDLGLTDNVIGLRVQDAQGQRVGSISDLILDMSTGQVAFAVITAGGFLGIGADSFVIPWKSITREPGAQSLTVSVPRPRLETAPRFSRNAWEDIARTEWAAAVFTYFGVEPYWDTAARASTGATRGIDADAAARLDALSRDMQRLQAEVAQGRDSGQKSLERIATRIEEISQRLDALAAASATERAPSAQVPPSGTASGSTDAPAPPAAPTPNTDMEAGGTTSQPQRESK